jgi:hypothetical protein
MSRSFAWTAGINGDIVDSIQGLVKDITAHGAQFGFEYNKELGGLSAAAKQSRYSDGNLRAGWTGRIYANASDVFNVYVDTEHYHDNMITTDYFSPGNYARYSLGAGFRKPAASYVFSGDVGAGRADADGIWSPVYSWKLSMEAPFHQTWSTRVTVGSAISNSSNYRYSYLNAGIEIPF